MQVLVHSDVLINSFLMTKWEELQARIKAVNAQRAPEEKETLALARSLGFKVNVLIVVEEPPKPQLYVLERPDGSRAFEGTLNQCAAFLASDCLNAN